MFAKPVTEIAGRGLAMQWPSQPTCALTLLLDHSILDGTIGHGDRTGKDSGQKWGDKFKEFQLTVFLEQVVRAYLPVAGAVGLVWGFLNYDLGMNKYESKSIRAEIDARLQAQRIEASQRRGWMVSLVADLEGKSKATMQKSAKCIELLVGVFSDSTIPNFALVPINPVGDEPIQWIYVVKILVVSSLASEKAKTEAREKVYLSQEGGVTNTCCLQGSVGCCSWRVAGARQERRSARLLVAG